MDRYENHVEFNKRWDFHEGRGRGARGQGQRGGRGRGMVEEMRGARERSMSRRSSEFESGVRARGRGDQGRIARGQRLRGGRGRGEVKEMVTTREDSMIRSTTEHDLGEMCNQISKRTRCRRQGQRWARKVMTERLWR